MTSDELDARARQLARPMAPPVPAAIQRHELRARAIATHPDRGGDPAVFREAMAAYRKFRTCAWCPRVFQPKGKVGRYCSRTCCRRAAGAARRRLRLSALKVPRVNWHARSRQIKALYRARNAARRAA